MNHSITILQKEAELIEIALKETNAFKRYPDKYKLESNRLKELREDITTLTKTRNNGK